MGINPRYNQEPEEEPQEVRRPRRELPSFPQESEMDDPFGGKPKRSRGSSNEGFMATWGKPLLAALVIGVIFALVISSGMTGLVTKSYDAKNWTDNTTALQQIKSQLTNVQKNIDTAMTNVNNAINQVDEKVNLGVSSGLAPLNSEISGYSNKINTLETQLNSLQSELNGVKSQAAGVSTLQASINDLQGKISTLTTQINTLQTSINTANSKITSLETKVAALEVKITEPPETTTTGVTGTGVYAAILSNPFFPDIKHINVSAQAVSTTITYPFNFSITNTTGKDITEIKLAVALGFYDAGGTISQQIPSGTVVTINLNGYLTAFTQQTTGVSSVLGYTNTVTTGVFGGMGNISQSAGVANYTITIAITTGATNPLPACIIMPNVQVVSYK